MYDPVEYVKYIMKEYNITKRESIASRINSMGPALEILRRNSVRQLLTSAAISSESALKHFVIKLFIIVPRRNRVANFMNR
jgi:hypothetical protein